jgi:hypothetical protein
MSPNRQNMLDLGIALLVDDFGQHHRVVVTHRADWEDLVLAVALNDDSVAVEPQHAVDLAHEPFRYAVAGLEHPSLFKHRDLFLGVPQRLSGGGTAVGAELPDGKRPNHCPCDGR